jgi:nucleotide-binding universal stress UspA family protein
MPESISTSPSLAVFLSYASQDAEAARRIAEALRAAGIEVWFDQNELVGGRYRVQDYRLICELLEGELIVIVVTVGHRSKVYD